MDLRPGRIGSPVPRVAGPLQSGSMTGLAWARDPAPTPDLIPALPHPSYNTFEVCPWAPMLSNLLECPMLAGLGEFSSLVIDCSGVMARLVWARNQLMVSKYIIACLDQMPC